MALGIILIVLAILVMWGFLSGPVKQIKNCRVKVSATIEEIVEGNVIVNGVPKYSAICTYYYKGEEYKSKVQFNREKYELKIGSTETIRINSDDPYETYVKSKEWVSASLMALFIGTVFFLVGAFIICEDIGIIDANNYSEEDLIVKQEDSLEDRNGQSTAWNDLSSEEEKGQNIDGNDSDSASDSSTSDKETTIETPKVNIFKVDKNTTLKLRQSPNYVQVYKNIKSDPKYKGYGSNMATDEVNGDKNYMSFTKLDKHMKEMTLYLPTDFQYITNVGYNYYYKASVTGDWLRVYIVPHKGNDVWARQMLNDIANYNRILGDINIPRLSNNNEYVTFDARNANGDYLKVACSVNKTYMVYIEYKHVLGTANKFHNMISTMKY